MALPIRMLPVGTIYLASRGKIPTRKKGISNNKDAAAIETIATDKPLSSFPDLE